MTTNALLDFTDLPRFDLFQPAHVTPAITQLLAAARANGKRLILPSAGIGALDILSSAAVGGLDRVTVTVRKDPSAWKGTVAETLVDLDGETVGRLPLEVSVIPGGFVVGAVQ